MASEPDIGMDAADTTWMGLMQWLDGVANCTFSLSQIRYAGEPTVQGYPVV